MRGREDDIEIRILDLTQLILWLNAVIDTGKFRDVTVEEVVERVDDGTVIPYLEERLADAGVMRPSFKPDVTGEITAAMQSLHDAHGGGRDWGINNNGLNALVAWTSEMIQQGAGEKTIRLPWSRR